MPPQGSISAEQAKLDDILKQQRDTLQSLNALNLEKEGVQAKIDDLNSKLEGKKEDLDALKAELDSISTARAGKLSELAEIQTQISQAKAFLETTIAEGDRARVANESSLQGVSDSQAKIVADAQAKVDGLQTEKIRLEKEIAPIAEQASRLTDQVTALNAQIVALGDKQDTAVKILNDLNSQIESVKSHITSLQETSDSLARDIADKKGQIAQLDVDIQARNDSKASLDKEIASLEETLKTNNDQNADFLKMREGLMVGQQEVEQRLAWLKSKYGDVSEPWG